MTEVSQAPAVAEPKGFGGWFILPLIATLLTPPALAYLAFLNAVLLLDGSVAGSGLAIFLAVECVYNCALVIAWIFAAALLFTRKRLYPRLFVALLVIMLIGTVLDLAVAVLVFDIPLDSSDVRAVARSLVGLAIWGPYMYQSKRVQNTFIED